MLLDWGVASNVHDYYGNTPCHYAAKDGRIDMLRQLMRHNVDIDARVRKTSCVRWQYIGLYRVHILIQSQICLWRNFARINSIIQYHVIQNTTPHEPYTLEWLRYLWCGIYVNQTEQHNVMNLQDIVQKTPLMKCARSDQSKAVTLLVNAGQWFYFLWANHARIILQEMCHIYFDRSISEKKRINNKNIIN